MLMHKRVYIGLPIVLVAAFLVTFAAAGCGEAAPPGTGNGTSTGTTTGTGTSTGTSTTTNEQIEREFFKAVNETRKSEGLNELVWCDTCAADAYVEAKDNAMNDHVDHNPCPTTCPHGYQGAICFFSYTDESIQAQVMFLLNGYLKSAPHRASILNSRATGMGCACVLNGGSSRYYHSAHFH